VPVAGYTVPIHQGPQCHSVVSSYIRSKGGQLLSNVNHCSFSQSHCV